MLGVILPSRGLIFAEVIDSVLKNLRGLDYRLYTSWNLTIPDCVNTLVEQALQENMTHFLFIEEDTVMPEHGFRNLFRTDADIACIDYGVAGYSCITRDSNTNEILWCGLGSTLVKRKVFDTLEKPYFRSDVQLLLNNYPKEEWIPASRDAYGGHDIYFCVKARKAGFQIVQVPGECKHLKLDSLGKPEINKGLHVISQKPKITKHQTAPL